MGKGKGKGFSRIAKLVTASARDQQASPQQVNNEDGGDGGDAGGGGGGGGGVCV